MPDFNKGDFTQQGVNGHVNATVRLNEKRLVNIDLTSNEEAEGCTITGAVTDLLNNEVYPIGAGVSGNIEITENGENINVAPYATATVNVSGGGGIPFCTITFVNNGNDAVYPVDYANSSFAQGYFEYNEAGYISDWIGIPAHSSGTYNVLYSEVNDNFGIVTFNASVTTSNYVNCKAEDGAIYVIDPSLPSSFTATVA